MVHTEHGVVIDAWLNGLIKAGYGMTVVGYAASDRILSITVKRWPLNTMRPTPYAMAATVPGQEPPPEEPAIDYGL